MSRKRWKAPLPPSWRAVEPLPPLDHWFVWPCGYTERYVGCGRAIVNEGDRPLPGAVVTRCEAGSGTHKECDACQLPWIEQPVGPFIGDHWKATNAQEVTPG